MRNMFAWCVFAPGSNSANSAMMELPFRSRSTSLHSFHLEPPHPGQGRGGSRFPLDHREPCGNGYPAPPLSPPTPDYSRIRQI